MEIIADLQVHSKYARAVSPRMEIPLIAEWAEKKGIALMGTGDFTHPLWRQHLKETLVEAGEDIFKFGGVKFLLTSEVSCVFSYKGQRKGVHVMVFLPGFSEVEKFSELLEKKGARLSSDGRPVVGINCRDVAAMAMESSEKALVIPAHAFTPWFGLYGANGGFDSLDEAFGDMAEFIYAVETGMSADPAMCWRVEELDKRQIVSFSDAHSPMKIGREATIFRIPDLSYGDIYEAIKNGNNGKIESTIEFYSEEGKYHFTGHRKCGVKQTPGETVKLGTQCPVCGRKLTVGVMHRIEQLASHKPQVTSLNDQFGVRMIRNGEDEGRPGFVMLVPLYEIVAEAMGSKSNSKSKALEKIYEDLVLTFGGELKVLLKTDVGEIAKVAGERVAEGIVRVRQGDIHIDPGFDGVYGRVSIWPSYAGAAEGKSAKQISLI